MEVYQKVSNKYLVNCLCFFQNESLILKRVAKPGMSWQKKTRERGG